MRIFVGSGISDGSDSIALETTAVRDGDDYALDGAKRWIGNGTIADVLVVWARDEEGKVGGYLVEGGTPGLETSLIAGKGSVRAVWQADITLTGVRVPAENRLPGANSKPLAQFQIVQHKLVGMLSEVVGMQL